MTSPANPTSTATDEPPCPGPCNARARRAWAAYEDAWKAYERACDVWDTADPTERGEAPELPEQPTAAVARGEPVWCDHCPAVIRRCLAELDDLMALRLTQADGHQAPAPPGQAIRGGESPSPSPGQDDLDTLVRELAAFESAYRAVRGWASPPRRGVAAPVLTSQLAWLSVHLDGILAVPDDQLAEDFGRWVLRNYARLQHLTSTRPPLRHKPLPCPRCHRRSLFWHESDENIHCHNEDCRRVMSGKEYGEYEAQADQQVQHSAASA